MRTWLSDLSAGLVVFLVALPLCLGIALASQAPLISGLLAGIIGGIVVGALSGSHTSVSGPAAALTAVIAIQINNFGSFQAFLAALIICGIVQIIIGALRAGFIAAFFPSSVINGLLSAIGLILVLKQVPHLVGWDQDFEGEMSFIQPDQQTTFSELLTSFFNWHSGSLLIGMVCLLFLIYFDSKKRAQYLIIPSQLMTVFVGLILNYLFSYFAPNLFVESMHRVNVPVITDISNVFNVLIAPDFNAFKNPQIYFAGLSLAIVASLATLLNLEAVDKIDPAQRVSPPNRELFAQGVGNLILGFIGGLPVTSVIVRGSVNINAQASSKKSAIFHGIFLLISVLVLPMWLNAIPLSCLAAILIVTGAKLVNIKNMKRIWDKGIDQFVPFSFTVVGILFTDLLVGIALGMGASIFFILISHYKGPLKIIYEKYFSGDVLRINLANQVSFLNRTSVEHILKSIKDHKTIIIDASGAQYIDADILRVIDNFVEEKSHDKNTNISLVGFENKFGIKDQVRYQIHTDQELQRSLTSEQILQMMKDGNKRFVSGQRIPRDFNRQLLATAKGQYPLAVTLSCIDSRTPVELIFDVGIGDIFSIRLAGNVVSERVMGSLEFACSIAGAKLIMVMGHTKCGAVSAAISLHNQGKSAREVYGCEHLDHLMSDIQKSMNFSRFKKEFTDYDSYKEELETMAVKANVLQSMDIISRESKIIKQLLDEQKVELVGCVFDITSGKVDFV
ncbi:MAG: bifunctional SulP family inorganic anion transporter/carbonic anhydrase [Myxococcales bacterium]|nr:MAG: bifunctional SulP family inorganic anion transporter/carbonic anhydrase [Myxococcales bacterium]